MSDYLHYCQSCNLLITDKYNDEMVCEKCLSKMVSLNIREDKWNELSETEKKGVLHTLSNIGSKDSQSSNKKNTSYKVKKITPSKSYLSPKEKGSFIKKFTIVLGIIIVVFAGILVAMLYGNKRNLDENEPNHVSNMNNNDNSSPNNNQESLDNQEEVIVQEAGSESEDDKQIVNQTYDYIREIAKERILLCENIPTDYSLILKNSYEYNENGINGNFSISVYKTDELSRYVIIVLNDESTENSSLLPSFLSLMMYTYRDFQSFDENVSILINAQKASETRFMILKDKNGLISYGFNEDGSEIINDIPDWLENGKPDEALWDWINNRNKEFWSEAYEVDNVIDPSLFIHDKDF